MLAAQADIECPPYEEPPTPAHAVAASALPSAIASPCDGRPPGVVVPGRRYLICAKQAEVAVLLGYL